MKKLNELEIKKDSKLDLSKPFSQLNADKLNDLINEFRIFKAKKVRELAMRAQKEEERRKAAGEEVLNEYHIIEPLHSEFHRQEILGFLERLSRSQEIAEGEMDENYYNAEAIRDWYLAMQEEEQHKKKRMSAVA